MNEMKNKKNKKKNNNNKMTIWVRRQFWMGNRRTPKQKTIIISISIETSQFVLVLSDI